MPVYVDAAVHKYGRMVMCHMTTDPETMDELHAMADRIGVARRWFQSHNDLPHYDICKSKRALAVANGAIEVGWRDIYRLLKAHRAIRAEEGKKES